MTIKEQDIFNFVFYPEKLNEIKRDEIKKDNNLIPIVNFYKNTKNVLLNGLTLDERIKLSRSIPDYKLDPIVLKPVQIPLELAINYKFIGEVEKENKMQFKIFQDKQKILFAKIYKDKGTNYLVLFVNTEIRLNYISVEIIPQKIKFHIKSYTDSIDIGEISNIREIHIGFDDSNTFTSSDRFFR